MLMREDGDETNADKVGSCSVVRTTTGLARVVAVAATDKDVEAAAAEEDEDEVAESGAEGNAALTSAGVGATTGTDAGAGGRAGTGADPCKDTCDATDTRGGVEATTAGGGDESPFDGLLKSICKLTTCDRYNTSKAGPRRIETSTNTHASIIRSRHTASPTTGPEPNPTVCGCPTTHIMNRYHDTKIAVSNFMSTNNMPLPTPPTHKSDGIHTFPPSVMSENRAPAQ